MGWFSPLKGAYPSLGQVDKTLPVSGDDVATIQRGMILALAPDTNNPGNTEGVWKIAGKEDTSLYVALQDYTDPAAGFAGTVFNDPKDGVTPGVPCITGLSLDQEGEYQTSVFDPDAVYAINDALTVVNGVITKAGDGDKVLGHVTGVPSDRWVNNAIALPPGGTDQRLAIRTGAKLSVLCFKTK